MKTNSYIGRRIIAGFIDYLIIYIFTLLMVFTFGQKNAEGEYIINGFGALIPIFLWLIVTVGLEVGTGSTIGNSIAGLKVLPASKKDRKLTFSESFKRRLLDPVDMFLFGLIGVITIINTENKQRVGDLWAKTIVIKKGNFQNYTV